MASSSTNSTKKSDDQHQESNSSSKNFNESKKVSPPTSSKILEEIDDEYDTVFVKAVSRNGPTSDLSPHLIQKQSYAPLSSAFISSIARPQATHVTRKEKRSTELNARPFEEVLVGQPITDVPPGTYPKPDNKPN